MSGKPHEFDSATPDGVQLVRVYRDDEGNWPDRHETPDGYVYVYPDGAEALEQVREENVALRARLAWYEDRARQTR